MNPTHLVEFLYGWPGLGRVSLLTPIAVHHQEVIPNLKCLSGTGHTLGSVLASNMLG